MLQLDQPVSQQQAQQLRRYDRERRIRLIQLFAPMQVISALIGGAVFLVIVFQGSVPFLQGPIGMAILAAILVVAGLFWLANYLASHNRLDTASALLLCGVAVLIFSVQSVYIFMNHFSSLGWILFAADGVLIVMTAAVGTRFMLILITLACSLYLVVALSTYDGIDPTLHQGLLGVQLSGVLILGAMGFYSWFHQSGFYRMAQDIGSLRALYEQAQQTEQLKDQFIISVNHELRNPIMAQQGYLDTLVRGWPQLDEETRYQFVQQALVSGQQVTRLLESILDIRRIEVQTRFTPTPIVVRESINRAVALLDTGAISGQRDLFIRVPPEVLILGDGVRLDQIFVNLLSNAMKYSAPGSAIEVSATILPAQGRAPGMVEVRVRDHGLGIPPGQIPLLFNRFVRLERDLASQVTGNGLGLYLCRQFTEAMGGTIGVESSGIMGEGSTFIVRLPLAIVPAGTVTTGSPSNEFIH